LHAAQHHHDDEIARAGPVHHSGTNKIGVIGKKCASKPAHRSRDYETEKLIVERGKPDRTHAALVRPRALDHHAEASIDDSPDQINACQQKYEAKVIKYGSVIEVEQSAELAAFIDRQPVVATVAVQSDCDIIDHLGKSERDHDEVDAARAQAQRTDDKRVKRRSGNGDGPLHESRCDAFFGENANHISADAEISSMAKTNHAAKPHDQIETKRCDRQNDDTGEQRQCESISGKRGVHRNQSENSDWSGIDDNSWRDHAELPSFF